jgi:hypothetical protein
LKPSLSVPLALGSSYHDAYLCLTGAARPEETVYGNTIDSAHIERLAKEAVTQVGTDIVSFPVSILAVLLVQDLLVQLANAGLFEEVHNNLAPLLRSVRTEEEIDQLLEMCGDHCRRVEPFNEEISVFRTSTFSYVMM